MVSNEEAKKAIDAVAEAHSDFFKRIGGVDDGDVLSKMRFDKAVNEVCKLLALAVLYIPVDQTQSSAIPQ